MKKNNILIEALELPFERYIFLGAPNLSCVEGEDNIFQGGDRAFPSLRALVMVDCIPFRISAAALS